jgi:hypothetical protein
MNESEEPVPGQARIIIENPVASFDNLQLRAAKAASDLRDRMRVLAFAGIGALWVFRQGPRAEPQLAPILIWALFAFSGALLVDFVQTFLASFGWMREKRSLERHPNETVLPPPLWPLEDVILYRAVLSRRPRYTWTFSYTAAALVIIGWTLVVWHALGLFSHPTPGIV